MDKPVPVITTASLELVDTEVLVAMLEYKTRILISVSKLEIRDEDFIRNLDSEVRIIQEEIKRRGSAGTINA